MAKLVPGETLSEQFVRALLQDVITGELASGSQLPSEGDLAAHYGVSRTVIREGIRELVGTGMIAKRQGQRSFIAPRDAWNLLDPKVLAAFLRQNGESKEILKDLFVTRLLIERYAAATASLKRDEQDLALLAEQIETMQSVVDNPEAFIQADLRFHELVQQAAKNLIVSSLLGVLNELLRVSRTFTMRSPEELQQLLQQHRAIFRAIESKDTNTAREAMAMHLVWIAESSGLELSVDDIRSLDINSHGPHLHSG